MRTLAIGTRARRRCDRSGCGARTPSSSSVWPRVAQRPDLQYACRYFGAQRDSRPRQPHCLHRFGNAQYADQSLYASTCRLISVLTCSRAPGSWSGSASSPSSVSMSRTHARWCCVSMSSRRADRARNEVLASRVIHEVKVRQTGIGLGLGALLTYRGLVLARCALARPTWSTDIRKRTCSSRGMVRLSKSARWRVRCLTLPLLRELPGDWQALRARFRAAHGSLARQPRGSSQHHRARASCALRRW